MAAGWTAERYSRTQGGARLRRRGDSPALPRGLRVVFATAQGAEKRQPAARLPSVTFPPPTVILSDSDSRAVKYRSAGRGIPACKGRGKGSKD